MDYCASKGGIITLTMSLAKAAGRLGIHLPDRELACAPINSPEGQEYIGAMNAAINVALANRQILAHLTREVFDEILPQANLETLFDVSHNTCKLEKHSVDGRDRLLYVHRKGATHAEEGMMGVIPGNMRDGSFIVRGKGKTTIDAKRLRAEITQTAKDRREVLHSEPRLARPSTKRPGC